jgi:hypothetical protein
VKYPTHRVGYFTFFFYLPRNKGPLKESPVHSLPNLGATEEDNFSRIICLKEAYGFDEVYCFGRGPGHRVIKKTI